MLSEDKNLQLLYHFAINSAALLSILLAKCALLNYTQLTLSSVQPLFNLFFITMCVSVVGEACATAGMWRSENVDV